MKIGRVQFLEGAYSQGGLQTDSVNSGLELPPQRIAHVHPLTDMAIRPLSEGIAIKVLSCVSCVYAWTALGFRGDQPLALC